MGFGGDFVLRDEVLSSDDAPVSDPHAPRAAGGGSGDDSSSDTTQPPNPLSTPVSSALADYDSPNAPTLTITNDARQGYNDDSSSIASLSTETSANPDATNNHNQNNDNNNSAPEPPEQEGIHSPLGYLYGLQEPAIYHDNIINMGGSNNINNITNMTT